MRRLLSLPFMLALLVAAVPLTITKTSSVVSDPTNQLFPKAIPGALVDYTITITNPAANSLTTVKTIDFKDAVPAKTKLYVADLNGNNSGPMVFTGSLIPTTGLTYSFLGRGNMSDSLSFSSDHGATWTYIPYPDADGCDAAVTNIRVQPTGNQTAGSNFTLRFRVMIK